MLFKNICYCYYCTTFLPEIKLLTYHLLTYSRIAIKKQWSTESMAFLISIVKRPSFTFRIFVIYKISDKISKKYQNYLIIILRKVSIDIKDIGLQFFINLLSLSFFR